MSFTLPTMDENESEGLLRVRASDLSGPSPLYCEPEL